MLIEDDHAVRQGVELALRRQGHEVVTSATGEEGLNHLHTFRPDVVVLDLMLPGISGLEVCRRIRAHDQIPLIMVTARGDDVDVIIGLEAGADDYVIKPVQARVLEARIRAVLRRFTDQPHQRVETHGKLAIDRAGLVITLHGTRVALAPSELRLLLTLSAASERAWGPLTATVTGRSHGTVRYRLIISRATGRRLAAPG